MSRNYVRCDSTTYCEACNGDDRYPHVGKPIVNKPHLTNLELTPTYDQPPTKSHSGDHMCNCERDYDTSDGHALDCTIRGGKDMVNQPAHYTSGGIECLDAIRASMTEEAFKGFLKGNVLKYMWRYEKKFNPTEDLKKAQWYLKHLEEANEKDKII